MPAHAFIVANNFSGCASVVADSMSPGRELDDVPLTGIAEGTPTPALGFCNPGTTNPRLWSRRQSAMKAAARLPELDPGNTGPARSSFGTAERSIFAIIKWCGFASSASSSRADLIPVLRSGDGGCFWPNGPA